MVVDRLKIVVRAYLCGGDVDPEGMKARLLAQDPELMVQAVNGSAARNERFVELLAVQTLHAEKSGSLLAKRPEIDFLLRIAGTTQISRAIKEKGARAGSPFLLVIAGSRPARGFAPVTGAELPNRELSMAELSRIERAALLSAKRP